jgi:prepilin-type N-terminal cleavage/methylation domain-containing protein
MSTARASGSKLANGFTLIEFGVSIAIIGVLGLAADQAARVSVVFLPAVQARSPLTTPNQPGAPNLPAVQSCAVTLNLFDDNGNILATKTVTVNAGQSKSLNYPPTPGVDPTAVELHASITIPQCPDNSMTCPMAQQAAQRVCLSRAGSFTGSLEILDASGKTVAALPAVQRSIIGVLDLEGNSR